MVNLGLNGRFSTLIYNTIKNSKTSGNIRKTRWLYVRALKGFFHGVKKNDEDIAKNFANQMDSMISVLNDVHGENWDFDIRSTNNDYGFAGFKLYVVINYPNINITNSEGDNHNIKNLVVSFRVKDSELENSEGYPVYGMYDIRGTRSSMTYEEWFIGYLHSHLSTNKFQSFSDAFRLGEFCLGEDTEIRYQQENLYAEYSPEMFQLFLWTIDSIVNWESLDGVPYVRMNKITIGTEASQVSMSDKRNLEEYYDNVRKFVDSLNVDFVFSESRYKIKQNNKFERFIHNLVVEYLSDYWRRLLVSKVGDKYYGYEHPVINTPEEMKAMFTNSREGLPHFYLRSNKVEFNVEPYGGELPDINNYKVHPKFIEYVSTRLEQELYYKSVRKSTFEKYHQPVDA